MQLSAMAKSATAPMVRLAVNEFHEFAAHGFGIALAEDGGAYHEDVCAGFLAGEDVVEFDAAVNLDVEFRLEGAEFANLVKAIGNQALAAESRVHRHNQDHVHDVEHVLDAFERGCRVDGHGGLDAEFGNLVQQTVQVVRGFGVHADDACAGFCKFAHVVLGVFDHQVAIERELGSLAHAGRDARAKADIWDKVSVHDVEVNKAGATVFDSLEAVAEFEEICVQHARGDNLLEHGPNIAKLDRLKKIYYYWRQTKQGDQQCLKEQKL